MERVQSKYHGHCFSPFHFSVVISKFRENSNPPLFLCGKVTFGGGLYSG